MSREPESDRAERPIAAGFGDSSVTTSGQSRDSDGRDEIAALYGQPLFLQGRAKRAEGG